MSYCVQGCCEGACEAFFENAPRGCVVATGVIFSITFLVLSILGTASVINLGTTGIACCFVLGFLPLFAACCATCKTL